MPAFQGSREISGAVTPTTADDGWLLRATAASTVTLTNSGWTVGRSAMGFRQKGAGQITFVAGPSVTLRNVAGDFISRAQHTSALVTYDGVNEWTIDGTEDPQLPDGSVTLAKLANLATDRIIGRVSSGTGVPQALTPAQVREVAQVAGPVHDVTHYGATGDGTTNDTSACAAALAAAAGGNGRVVFPAGGTFMIAEPGLIVASDTTIEIEAGAVVEMIPNALTGFNQFACCQVVGVSDVVIFGQGTLRGERADHVGSGGEGFGVLVRNSQRVHLEGFTTEDHWTDGIYIGGNPAPCEVIDVLDVTARNNRRQGMSITNAHDVVIENFRGLDTNGTLPESGIDLEPNPGQTVTDVRIVNAYFEGNAGNGFKIQGEQASLSNITVDGMQCFNNALYGVNVWGPVHGFVTSGVISKGNTAGGWYLNSAAGDVEGAIDLGIIEGNDTRGAFISDGKVYVTGGRVVDNTGDGITLVRADSTVISGVLFAGNTVTNLDVRSGANVRVTRNVFQAGTATPTNHFRNISPDGGVVRLFNDFDGAAPISDAVSATVLDMVNGALIHTGFNLGVEIADGGTGATTAAGARTNLVVPEGSVINTSTLRIGPTAGAAVTTAATSTLIGRQAGLLLTTGASTTAIGSNAGLLLNTGSSNTAIGASCLDAEQGGSSNTAIGVAALGAQNGASNNTSIGRDAGALVTTGSSNTLAGHQAGDAITTGASNTIIGATADAGAAINGGVAVGAAAVVSHNSAIALGQGATTTATFQLHIGGRHIEMVEMTEPAAGATNSARLYSRDNGSGKTQLCVRFAMGAVQVLATEP